ncbi:MAG: hypothetical protein EBR82_11750 [Caulobacteraceae bacterium]|nr:hypothetical protein [Caulobacteraceae bacterium]
MEKYINHLVLTFLQYNMQLQPILLLNQQMVQALHNIWILCILQLAKTQVKCTNGIVAIHMQQH